MRLAFLLLAIILGCSPTEGVDMKLRTRLASSLRQATDPTSHVASASYQENIQAHLAGLRLRPNHAHHLSVLEQAIGTTVDLSGYWTASDSTTKEIIQTGNSLLIHWGDSNPDSTGTVKDSETIEVSGFDETTLTATVVQEGGLKLEWSNGDVWTWNGAATAPPAQNHYYGGGQQQKPKTQSAAYCGGGPTQSSGVRFIRLMWYGDNPWADTTACDNSTGVVLKNVRDIQVRTGHAYVLWYWAAYCLGLGPREDSPTARHSAWADWNQNGIFEDNEALWQGVLGDADGPQDFSVPLSAKMGTTRLRIVFIQGEDNLKPQPCNSFAKGDARDYLITVSPGYCSSGGPTSDEDSEILSVQLQGEANTMLYDTEGCPGGTGVTDQSSTHNVVILYPGRTYTLKYNAGTCDDIYDFSHTAWADWNGDLIFQENEQLFPISTKRGLNARDFTVPLSAPVGTTRLRIQLKESGDGATVFTQSPCVDFDYGDTKDYSVFVHLTTAPTYDAAGYCSTGGPLITAGAEYLGVSLIGESGTRIQDNQGCPGVIGIRDFTNLNANLIPGHNYTLKYYHYTCDQLFEALHTAWIDFNQDLQFQATEQLYPSSEDARLNSHDFQVPADAKLGPTRLRLQLAELIFLGKDFVQNPCEDVFYGDTRDYTVTFVKAVYFNTDVYPIIQQYAAGHLGTNAKGGLNFGTTAESAYRAIVNVPSNEAPAVKRINPGDPDTSYVWLKLNGRQSEVNGTGSRMPPGPSPLPADKLATIETWIRQGALFSKDQPTLP